jgi:hypothetical protein
MGQFGQSVFGLGVSFTKHDSHTRVPSFSVKSTLRLKSISDPHFPQSSVCASLISTLDHLCDDARYQPGCAPTLASRQAKHPQRLVSRFALRWKPVHQVTHGTELHLPLPQRDPEVCFGRSQEQRPGIAPTSYSRSYWTPERRLLTQPCCSLNYFHRSASTRKNGRHNSGNDTGVHRWPRGDIFRVDHSDASENSQRFRNLDTFVFRPCSTPLPLHLLSREHPQSATPSELARSRVLRGGCGRMLVRHFDRTRF